jgi:2-methylcitrate dehydratase PrpD
MAARYGVNIKRYPTCYATHRSIDAMLDLVDENDIAPSEIAKINVHTGVTQQLMLRNARPQTGLAAKFSMEFAMASAVVARRVGLKELTDEFVSRSDVQSMLERVEVTVSEEEAGEDLPFAPFDLVWITLKDGTVLRHEPVEHARGSWQMQLDREALKEKFEDCAGILLPEEKLGPLFEKLYRIEAMKDLRELDLV